ncbi:MAG TPA: DUF4147 domain-containing protein [Anaerolineae bacterium]
MAVAFQSYSDHIDQLIQAALAAADPGTAVRQHLRHQDHILTINGYTYDRDEGRIFLVSTGKAAVPMGLAAAEILHDCLEKAVIISKKTDRDWRLEIGDWRFSLHEGNHPVSGEDSLRATKAAIDMLSQTETGDLVLCLVSGGSSALLTQPLIPLDDWQQLNKVLLSSGCTIDEFNTVRRQLDRVKGGGLARLAAPAACVSLILSDVVGNPLAIIGSGPTVPSGDTPADALEVLERYHVESALEPSVWRRVTEALQDNGHLQVKETELYNLIVSDVRQAARAAVARARQLGFTAQLLTARLEGEAREVGRIAAAIAKDTLPGHCLIMGGETTVTLRGDGTGGRNQEVALAAAIALDGWPNVALASIATDGEDGPTDAAGAVVTGRTVGLAHDHGLEPHDFLDRNDSYTFFKQLDYESREDRSHRHLIQTGPTGTNVNDLLFILTYPKDESSSFIIHNS